MTYPAVSGNMSFMPRILGIDTSLTGTGLARIDIAENDDSPVSKYSFEACCATVSAPKPNPKDKSKRAMARRVNALIAQIEPAIDCGDYEEPKVDLIAIESLAYGAKGASVWVLPWIFGRVLELAEKYDIPLIEVGTGQIKKYATGSGVADKSTVVIAVSKRWPEAEVKNDNESDAMTAGAVGCHYLGLPIVGTVTKYHDEVLAAIRKSEAATK